MSTRLEDVMNTGSVVGNNLSPVVQSETYYILGKLGACDTRPLAHRSVGGPHTNRTPRYGHLKLLQCGHRCTSLCGEPCEDQVCIECASEDEKATAVDMIKNNTIADLALGSDELDSPYSSQPRP